jgi:hypothetical protein
VNVGPRELGTNLRGAQPTALKAEQQRIEAKKRAAEQQRKRQDETRRKVLVGAVVLAKLEDGTYPETEFTTMMEAALTWAEDRRLFGLVVGEPDTPTEAEPQS